MGDLFIHLHFLWNGLQKHSLLYILRLGGYGGPAI